MPVSAEAIMWLMSAQSVARNLVRGAVPNPVDGRSVTLPASRETLQQLALGLSGKAPPVRYEPESRPDAKFDAFPPRHTPAAVAMGFRHTGSLKGFSAATQSFE
jgi:D-erythronate 2-dehydrogenase